jgi:hypothetical protein
LKNLLFNTVGLMADDVQALENSYKALQAKFNIGLPDHSFHLNKFELFNNEQEASVIGTFLINYPSTDCYINLVKIHYNFTAGKSRQNYFKCQAWAFVTLKNDFGRVLIRQETFADRVLEIVHHTELKFKDDKVFSNNFYVVNNDPEKALLAMTPDFRNIIKTNMYPGFVAEVIKDTLVIRNSQPIVPADTVHLAEFASKIAALR